MTRSHKRKECSPQGAVVLVASSIVRHILGGETDIADNLVAVAADNDIVLLKSCLCEALKECTSSTVEGLHAVGRLLSLSRIVSFSPEEDVQLQSMKHAHVTADALLSRLIGPLATADNSKELFGQLWLKGVVPMTRDVDLAATFACVREGDELHLGRFASTLTVLFLENTHLLPPGEWFVSEEFIDELRTKAMATDAPDGSEGIGLSRTEEG